MIINSDVDPKAPFLAERSFLRVYLEACEGFQCRPKIFRSTETPQPRCVLRKPGKTRIDFYSRAKRTYSETNNQQLLPDRQPRVKPQIAEG